MQDNQLHANLSVEEAMHVATSLKLGSDISEDSKYQVVSLHAVAIPIIYVYQCQRQIVKTYTINSYTICIIFRFKKF